MAGAAKTEKVPGRARGRIPGTIVVRDCWFLEVAERRVVGVDRAGHSVPRRTQHAVPEVRRLAGHGIGRGATGIGAKRSEGTMTGVTDSLHRRRRVVVGADRDRPEERHQTDN